MSTISSPAEQRVILANIRWSTYEAILNDAETRRGRMAFDEGVLEIMAPSKAHENAKSLIGRLIETFTEQLGIDVCSVGSTTFKREDLQKGFESDECYYIAHAAAVREKDEIDLTVDPAPDLAVEVDISRTSMGKFRIYGAIGVPEVWRYDGTSLRVYVHLQADEYQETQRSQALPQLPIDVLVDFLNQRHLQSETQIIRSFRAWVGQQFGSA